MYRKFNKNRQRSRFKQSRTPRLDHKLFIKKAAAVPEEENFTPSFDFSNIQVNATLKSNILQKGYTTPTPIQDKTIMEIMQKKDVLGIANTGTGKTAAFLIPLIHNCVSNPTMKVLILTPTRELATQIQSEFNSFSRNLRVFSALCVGGMWIGKQIQELKRNPQFLIATPGRLKDLQERRSVNLSQYNHLVLDEADRMVDMGFIDDIRDILSKLPGQRQSMFFTATLPPDVKSLIHSFLKNPVSVSVKKQDTAANIDQDIIRIAYKDNKMDVLINLLKQTNIFTKVLIFGRTKRGVDRIARGLEEKQFPVVSIHGDKVQSKRQKALDLFKSNRAQILVATDVAARGLDIPNVSHVINFDMPQSYEDYIHRIGRTGRANKKGKALTFID